MFTNVHIAFDEYMNLYQELHVIEKNIETQTLLLMWTHVQFLQP